MREIVLIVEASFLGVKYCVEAAMKLNFTPVVLSDLSIQEGDALRQILSVKYVECDTRDVDEIIVVINHFGRENIRGIITFLDSRLLVVSEVCKRLDLPGIDSNILEYKDKAGIDKLMHEDTPDSISVQRCAVSEFKRVKNFIKDASCEKFIAKPRFGAGGRGSFSFNDYNEFSDVFHQLHKASGKRDFDERYIIQSYHEGELISIEGYICNGNVIFLGANGRRKVGNTESSCLFPYNEIMGEDNYLKCCSISKNLLFKMNLDNSFFHLEFIVADGAVRLIDANLGRPAGGNVLEMLAHSFDLQVSDFYAQVLSVHILGEEYIHGSYFERKSIKKSLGVLYGVPEASKIYGIKQRSEVISYHNISINIGKFVSEMGKDNWSIVGTLAGNIDTVINDLLNIVIEVDLGFVKPKYALFGRELLIDD